MYLSRSQVCDGRCIDDEVEGGAVSKVRKDLLNCSQVCHGRCITVDEDDGHREERRRTSRGRR